MLRKFTIRAIFLSPRIGSLASRIWALERIEALKYVLHFSIKSHLSHFGEERSFNIICFRNSHFTAQFKWFEAILDKKFCSRR